MPESTHNKLPGFSPSTETQLSYSKKWESKFRKYRYLTIFGFGFFALGQSIFLKAIDLSPRFVYPESWEWKGIKTAANKSFSKTTRTEVHEIFLAIPGTALLFFGLLLITPGIIAFLGWWIRSNKASKEAGRKSYCPWQLSIASFFVPIVQFFTPPILLAILIPKSERKHLLLAVWWILFMITVFTVFSGGGALPGLGPVSFLIGFSAFYTTTAFFAVRSTIKVMDSINTSISTIKTPALHSES